LEAARFIEQEALTESLGTVGQWRMLEAMIRATMQPELPLSTLGQLYNQLSIAAWRQSHIGRAEPYAAKALEIGRRSGSRAVLAAANLNLGTLAAFRGRLKKALSFYRECIRLSRALKDELTRAKAMSNCGAVHLDAGDFREAIRWQRRAIQSFAQIGKPTNECIAWLGLSDAHLIAGKFKEAWRAAARAHSLAARANYRRGRADASLIKAEILARRGQFEGAANELNRARSGFDAIDIHEARLELTAALIERLRGNVDGAARFLEQAAELAREFPLEKARVLALKAALTQQRTKS
jgi:tetratricopeptide (TPR) repeat protein